MGFVQPEINEQTIPPKVWGKLTRYWLAAHGQMHRGTFGEMFDMYVEGVADGLELNKGALIEYVKEEVMQGHQ